MTNLFGQDTLTVKDRFMSYDQNENWLKAIKKLDRTGQWIEIRQRYFSKENWNVQHDSVQYLPLIIVNGIPLQVSDSVTAKNKNDILNLLNESSIDQVNIVDTISDKWIFCKPFSGVVILSVDKRTEKKLFKLKLE